MCLHTHICSSIYSPLSPLSDGFVCQTTGLPPLWCLTIHLLYVQAASDCSLPATEGDHLEQWDDLTSVETNVCLSVLINETRSLWSCLKNREITWLTLPTEVVYSQMNTTWNSDQQTFLNPNAAPLCQLYASLLKDSAESFKQLMLSLFHNESQRLLLAAQTASQIRVRIDRFINHLILINLGGHLTFSSLLTEVTSILTYGTVCAADLLSLPSSHRSWRTQSCKFDMCKKSDRVNVAGD